MTVDNCSINYSNRTDCENAGCYWWQTAGICSTIPEPSECTKKDLSMHVGDIYVDSYSGIIEFNDVDPNCPAENALAYIRVITPWGSIHNITAEEVGNVKANYFVYSNNDRRYAVTVKFMCGMETAPIIVTTCHWIEEPPLECIDYSNQDDCEANGCYWWSDNTCQNAPEGTTEYFDVYIKPYPWYNGKYQDAVSNTLEKVTELTGSILNYMSGITNYEYIGLDILEDTNENVVIIRVYLRKINMSSLVPPLLIGAILGIIAGILLLSIGYIIGTDQGTYTPEEVIDTTSEDCDKAIKVCKERYPNRHTDPNEAKLFVACVAAVDTVRIIIAGDVGDEDVTETIENIDNAANDIIIGIDDGNISIEDIDDIVDNEITKKTKDDVAKIKAEIELKDCYIKSPIDPTKCLITDKQAKFLMWSGIVIAALYTLSVAKPVIKGAGEGLQALTKK